MPITYVDNDYLYGASTSVVSQAIDLGAAADRAVAFFCTSPAGETLSAAITGGGTSLTLIASRDDTFGGQYAKTYIFGAVVSESGSQTITVSSSGSGLKFGWATSYSGVGSIRGGAVNDNETEGFNGGPRITLTTVSGDTMVLIGHDNERASTYTWAGGATERFDASGAVGADLVATGTSTQIAGTLSADGAWGAGAVALVPAGGATQNLSGSACTGGVGSQSPGHSIGL